MSRAGFSVLPKQMSGSRCGLSCYTAGCPSRGENFHLPSRKLGEMTSTYSRVTRSRRLVQKFRIREMAIAELHLEKAVAVTTA